MSNTRFDSKLMYVSAICFAASFLLLPLFVFPSLLDKGHLPRLTGVSALMGLSSAGLMAASLLNAPLSLKAFAFKPAVPLYFLFVLMYAVSWSWTDYWPLDTDRPVVVFLSFQLFVLGGLFLIHVPRFLTTLLKIIVVGAAIFIGQGVIDLLSHQFENSNYQAYLLKIQGSLSHKNLYASCIFLLLPFLGMASYTLGSWWRITSRVLFVAILPFILFLQTRAIWLAFGTGIIFTLASLLFLRPHVCTIWQYGKHLVGGHRFLSCTGLGLALIVISAIAFLPADMMWERITYSLDQSRLKNIHQHTIEERMHLWHNSWKMITDHPLTGAGGGEWPIAHMEYGIKPERATQGVTYFQRPHNDFLWIWSESGLFPLLAYLMLIGYVVWVCLLRLREGLNKPLTGFALFGISGFVIISFFSFPIERTPHMSLLALLLAIPLFDQTGTSLSVKPGKEKQFTGFVFAGCVLINLLITLFGMNFLQAESALADALRARQDGRYQQMTTAINRAMSPVFQYDYSATPLVYYKGEAHFMQRNYAKALPYFKKACRLHPYHLQTLNSTASTYFKLGQQSRASRYYHKALQLSPSFAEALVNLAIINYKKERIDSALQLLAQVPPSTKTTQFQKTLTVIYQRAIASIIDTTEQPLIKESMRQIRSNKEWLRNIHEKVYRHEEPLSTRLIKDVFYKLEKVDSIPAQRSKELRAHYPHIGFDYTYP